MTKAIIAGLVLTVIVLVLYILYKSRKFKEINDKIFEKELLKDSDPLNRQALLDLDFRIFDTKDKIYAIHPNGVSLTYEQDNKAWHGEIKHLGQKWNRYVHSVGELKEYCKKHNKPL